MKPKERITYKNGVAVIIDRIAEKVSEIGSQMFYDCTFIFHTQIAIKRFVRHLQSPEITREDYLKLVAELKSYKQVSYKMYNLTTKEINELFEGKLQISSDGFVFCYENDYTNQNYSVEIPSQITYTVLTKLGSLPVGNCEHSDILEKYLLEWRRTLCRNVIKSFVLE